MSEYKPTEYIVDFGDCRSNQFIRLNMALIEQNSAKLGERIVRCRDCEHGLFGGNMCDRLDPGFDEYWFEVKPDGFCAWGAREEVDA